MLTAFDRWKTGCDDSSTFDIWLSLCSIILFSLDNMKFSLQVVYALTGVSFTQLLTNFLVFNWICTEILNNLSKNELIFMRVIVKHSALTISAAKYTTTSIDWYERVRAREA